MRLCAVRSQVAARRLIDARIPAGEVELLIAREWAILAGENDYTTDTFQQITGRRPRPFGRVPARAPRRVPLIRHAVLLMEVRRLPADDVALLATIDRTEHVDVEYRVVDGRMQQIPATIPDIAPWEPTGSGPHSVAAHVAFCESAVARGGILLGAFDGDQTAGLAIINPTFEPQLAWLAVLHVSRPFRRKGAAQSLWNVAADIAAANGAASMYVSATPTESAVGFYLRQGCRLADPVHPELFAAEPDDIHLVRSLK
jgi:GNAT superfamily N-acetyltransferase